MSEDIRFETITIEGDRPSDKRDGVAVIRDGRQVAVIPEAERLDRALSLPLDKIEHIVNNLRTVMLSTLDREPTRDEEDFWHAVLDFQRNQKQSRKASD